MDEFSNELHGIGIHNNMKPIVNGIDHKKEGTSEENGGFIMVHRCNHKHKTPLQT
jgi:hypothetical protein